MIKNIPTVLKSGGLLLAVLSLVCCLLSMSAHKPAVKIKTELDGYAQGTTWHSIYYAESMLVSKNDIDSILRSIDSSLSIYKKYSKISAFNASDSGIIIDEHFRKVIEKSLDTYINTKGLFDITVLPLVEAWGFGATRVKGTPDSATIDSLRGCVSSATLKLRNNMLIKTKPCVTIDVNGIAQGYSVDVLAAYFERMGIFNYLIELGGEVRVKGKKATTNETFKVGIETPSDNDFLFSPPLEKVLLIDSGAITTSGNYRKYHESRGKKISHLIDPRTGYSVQNELISATVFAKDAITADAYDNALMLMGVDSAMRFVESRADLAAFFIYKSPEGVVSDTSSSRFRRLIKQ